MKKTLAFLLLSCEYQYTCAQIAIQETFPDSSSSIIKKPFLQKKAVKIGLAPTLLFVASAATWAERAQIRDLRNRYIPNFKVPYDDYLQYLPGATAFGLKLAGVKGRNKLGRATLMAPAH